MPMLRISDEGTKTRLLGAIVGAALLVALGTLIYLAFPRDKALTVGIQLAVVFIFALLISLLALLPSGWLHDKKNTARYRSVPECV